AQSDGLAHRANSRRRAVSLVERELARADRDGEPVLAGRQRAAPRVVVCAVRVVGAVEIQLEAAVVERLRLHIAARTIGLVPARRIAERDEESVALRERDEAGALAVHLEPPGTAARELSGRSVAT